MNQIDPNTLERMIHVYVLFHSLVDQVTNIDEDLLKDAQSLASQTLNDLTNQYLSTHSQEDLEQVLSHFSSKINQAPEVDTNART